MTTMVDDVKVHTLLFAARITRDASHAYFTSQYTYREYMSPDNDRLLMLEWQLMVDEAIVEFFEGMVAALPVPMHQVHDAAADAERQCADEYAAHLPVHARARMLGRAAALRALTTMTND